MKPFNIIKYQLYLLQLENYELRRFWKLVFKKGLMPSREPLRKRLVWTNKARGLALVAMGLHLILALLLAVLFHHIYKNSVIGSWLVFSVSLIMLFFFYFLLFALALWLLWPLDFLAKKIIIGRAKKRIRELENLKVIGIAGSYGKTTMKEVLKQVLGVRFQVLATPESINTPVGIARWALKYLGEKTQIAIIEMGEHYQGDIKEICEIARPDIAVVTGINEAHLERMKRMETVTATIFELVGGTKEKALVVLNGDDGNVMDHYKEYAWPDHRVEKFQISNFKFQKFSPEKLGWEGVMEGLGKVEVSLMGKYSLGDVSGAVIIARELGMADEEIRKGIGKVKPVEHRLQPIAGAGDILVIDDSYNANPQGVSEAIKVLEQFENRRKVFITPGMVETGKAAAELHRRIGEQLAGAADVVVLIKNSVTPNIELGIRNYELGERQKPQIIWFNTAPEAHENLKNILRPGDVVMFQNDWGDQYV
ncbi:MAG: UDP-N-acetylmuramoyl-tripeptide--D-alanyl-D-alanine ligase [Patescibacteria group bacterium]|nr:UDP-N-acetylmuramoyl-tripeptide--D-alanyl-D-alanine ligase [Patescibacteria group bacterium]